VIDGHRSRQKTLRADIVDPGQLDCALTVASCSKFIGARLERAFGQSARNSQKDGIVLMAIHKTILEWQAAHPNITWIGWGIVWVVVLSLLFWPSKGLG
jgi:hypothetical protein